MTRVVVLALLALLTVIGCGDEQARIAESACTIGVEHRLAVPDGPEIHDVALAFDGERGWALWSDRSGAFARALDAQGAPAGDARRIGPPCDGGIAAEARGGELLVACARRGDDARDDPGSVVLLRAGGGATTTTPVGEVGPDGDGVSIAARGDDVWLGWQSAHGAVSSAWIARAGTTAERLSPPRVRAGRPTIALEEDGTPLVAWGESWLDARGEVEGRIQLRRGQRAARAVAELTSDVPAPVLRGEGAERVIAFRDRRPAGSRPRVHVASIDDEGLGRVEASSHANTVGEAVAVPCGGHVLVVAPRTHSRTERLVSVRRYGADLTSDEPEHQLYEHGSAFEHADARCVGGQLVVLFAGRPSRVHEQGTIRTAQVTCGE